MGTQHILNGSWRLVTIWYGGSFDIHLWWHVTGRCFCLILINSSWRLVTSRYYVHFDVHIWWHVTSRCFCLIWMNSSWRLVTRIHHVHLDTHLWWHVTCRCFCLIVINSSWRLVTRRHGVHDDISNDIQQIAALVSCECSWQLVIDKNELYCVIQHVAALARSACKSRVRDDSLLVGAE